MAIIGSGFDRGVSGAGTGTGYQGLPYDEKYGFPLSAWLDLNVREQELIIQDYNRTDKQANYYKDSDQAKAFEYVSFVDDKVKQGKDVVADVTTTATKGIELAILAVGLAFLATRR